MRSLGFALASLVSVASITACGAPPGDSSSSAQEAIVLPGPIPNFQWHPLTCSTDGKSCVATGMPLLWQGDDVLLEYDWHIYPDETFKTPADKGSAVSEYGCYDTAMGMINIAALTWRSPSDAPAGSRTREILSASTSIPTYDPATGNVVNKTFTKNQAVLLYAPVSNYDGGGPAHDFSTRGNAYHFPELLADLGTVTHVEPAGCDPRIYFSCSRVESTAGIFQLDWLTSSTASIFTNQRFLNDLNAGYVDVLGFSWPTGGMHKVVVAGYDLNDAAFPIVIYDPGNGTKQHIRFAQTYSRTTGQPVSASMVYEANPTSFQPIQFSEKLLAYHPNPTY